PDRGPASVGPVAPPSRRAGREARAPRPHRAWALNAAVPGDRPPPRSLSSAHLRCLLVRGPRAGWTTSCLGPLMGDEERSMTGDADSDAEYYPRWCHTTVQTTRPLRVPGQGECFGL